MAKMLKELETELLALPETTRARLAQKLLASLDEPDDVETAWYDEAERGVAEYLASGEVPVPLEEVMAELRRRPR